MTLEDNISRTINEMAPVLEKIPGVVIIHYLNPSKVIFMSQSGQKILNVPLAELQGMKQEYYDRFFNPEDATDYVPKVLGMLERNNDEETISFFQQVRASKDEDWKWYVSGTRIFMHDNDGNPYLTITVAIPIDSKHYFTTKIERLLEENEFLRTNHHLFSLLTKREKQILVHMAKNKSSVEIGETLYLSEETVKTHRRNIKKKIRAQTQYDIIQFAQAFNFI